MLEISDGESDINETLLLSYQEIDKKDDVTTRELVTDILLEYDLLEFVRQLERTNTL